VARTRIAARCEEDIAAIEPDDALGLIDKFEETRRQAPESGDLINNLTKRLYIFAAQGRYHAATCCDTQLDVVWLLAAGVHRSGDRDDFYTWAVGHERAGHLYPTAEDYEDFADDLHRDRLVQEAMALRAIREEVLTTPGAGRRTYTSMDGLYAEIWAEVIEELALVVVRLRLTRLSGQWLGAHELAILVEGPLGPNPRPRPEDDWRFRSFEEYVPLPPRQIDPASTH
jgi:hypothetical protein